MLKNISKLGTITLLVAIVYAWSEFSGKMAFLVFLIYLFVSFFEWKGASNLVKVFGRYEKLKSNNTEVVLHISQKRILKHLNVYDRLKGGIPDKTEAAFLKHFKENDALNLKFINGTIFIDGIPSSGDLLCHDIAIPYNVKKGHTLEGYEAWHMVLKFRVVMINGYLKIYVGSIGVSDQEQNGIKHKCWLTACSFPVKYLVAPGIPSKHLAWFTPEFNDDLNIKEMQRDMSNYDLSLINDHELSGKGWLKELLIKKEKAMESLGWEDLNDDPESLTNSHNCQHWYSHKDDLASVVILNYQEGSSNALVKDYSELV